ncbi:lipopolysaccharide biosynthesis protein [Psychroserpens ponticola]|uniref:Lipopolysaccharide biosynthesis protein n=1 Tax=Psychroserpens ponticola TaxID=2932268 RepID=A0ABY7RVI5_9FLAO|nr:lipopolysaccharide biosynthesis protein [Psychroserpens ponticola]WCO01136.1 lipopolysaccharide biosynthesis protein [Psychroserpens ponticola]
MSDAKKKNKIIKGGFYLTIVNVLSQLLAIVVNIVLARLLLPEDFGLVALTMTYIGFITLFTNMGFGSSIIYESETSQKQLSSIYWLNYGLSVFSFLVIISTSQFAANFYNEPKLTSIVFVAAFNLLIFPFYIVQYKLLERDLEFRTISKINLSGILIGSIAAVIGAYLGLGVYALILQSLVVSVVRLFMVMIYRRWLPSFYFNFHEIKSMVWYSLKYKASNMVRYFERNIDYLILGKFFSSVILGYYAFAYNIMYTPVKRISYIFSEVLFPSFSSFKNDKEKIISGYFKSVNLIALVSIPAMTILAFNADLIIHIGFGQKWDGAIAIVKILCFAGAIQSVSQFGGVIFSSIGKPEITLYISVGRTILTVLAIVIGVQYGVLWVAYLLVIAKVLSFLLFLVVLYSYIPFSIIQLFNSLKGPMVSFISLSLIYALVHFNYLVVSPWTLLLTMLVVSVMILYIFHKNTLIEILKVLKEKAK